ncbi:DNA gyrase inhibitor YacG [Thiolapillus sp.]
MNRQDRKPVTVNCPTCSTPVPWDETSPWRPFCSRRCQLIDLNEWLADEDEEQREEDHLNPQ